MRPEFCKKTLPFRKSKGAGKAGYTLYPRSRVQMKHKNAHTSIQVSGGTPTFPAQWLYGLLRAHPGERALLSPSSVRSACFFTNLMPASRHQVHTTSPY